ncbi:hypothetical protein GDO81_017481 [Engystomops pustulosus]|uniref:WD repeat, SAM and U-box domain-containing protein 1 n=1 Tax=Engystomops pustulosus TaxID=76066 RepID=A0AAV7AIF4_ENGPU|nr:hypothetical protein GDO81_017481 [Engystomops pustulosus]KAG8559893.1 hypothetical protein GDO81_017481 [Engystomops pustulosus]KAG8559894.1 hypothetical protein GDO81_017481 [Engystomops pustulosus]KAG8559895.1 hypothetical protein GDO81_017481 [Engystomops pustulosus]
MVELVRTLADHIEDVNCCSFSDSLLATCSLDKTIRIYSLKDFQEVSFSPLRGHTYAVHCCCFSPNQTVLASCSTDGKTILWNTCNGQILASLEQPSGSPVRVCRFSPNAVYLVSGAADGSVVLWNVPLLKFHRYTLCTDKIIMKTGCILHILTHHKRYVTACALAANLPLLATGSMDKTVTIWKFGQTTARIRSKTEFDIESWTEDDVRTWLSNEGLAEVERHFTTNNIDGRELLCLTKEMLLQDLKIESLGLRNKILRKIEDLKSKMKATSSNVPEEFLCPITCEIMKDPVIASDGYSYERKAIESWISTKRTSPMTNLPLENLLLTPNRTLKMALNRWLDTSSKYISS